MCRNVSEQYRPSLSPTRVIRLAQTIIIHSHKERSGRETNKRPSRKLGQTDLLFTRQNILLFSSI